MFPGHIKLLGGPDVAQACFRTLDKTKVITLKTLCNAFIDGAQYFVVNRIVKRSFLLQMECLLGFGIKTTNNFYLYFVNLRTNMNILYIGKPDSNSMDTNKKSN